MKIHPDVLAAHAQFGGNLNDMQRRYDAGLVTSENTDRSERMTGTPSKDRAEAYAGEAKELLVRYEYLLRGTGYKDEIFVSLISEALATSFAEGMKRATDALDKYRASLADIPLGHENPQRGASTYNWKVAVFEEIRDAINCEIGEA